MTIRRKFVIFSILWGMILVAVLSSAYITNFRSKGIELIKQNLITSSNDQALHLEAFFSRYIRNLKTNSSTQIVHELLTNSNSKTLVEDEQQDVKVLDVQKKQDSSAIGQLLFNKHDIMIARTGDIQISSQNLFSKEEWERIENNKVVVTNIVEDNTFNNGVKSAIIAYPIFFEGRYQGCIASIINMDYFDMLVNRVGSFKTGKVSVIDENGVIAVSNNSDLTESISKITTSNNLYDKWENIDFRGNPNGIIEYNIDGIEKIGYYVKVNNTEWIILSDVEWSEFKEPINKSIMDISIFFILILLIAVSAYAFVINYFSRPMDSLLEVIRKIKQGNYNDRFIYDEENEFGEIATAFNELIDNIQKNKRHIENRNRELQSITSNIPGGVHRDIMVNGEYYVDFLSSGCLKIIGYKNNELKEVVGKNIFDIIYEKDHERVRREIRQQVELNNKFTVEYRIKHKDGSIIWVLNNGRIVRDKNGKTFSYNVIIDITNSKIALEELRLSEERYRIITSQTDDIIFEWNVRDDTMLYSGNLNGKIHFEKISENITEKIYDSQDIYNDDKKIFGEMLNDIIRGEPYREAEIRIKKNDEEYSWCKIRITPIFDANGNISKAIGVISDIDKEKRETEELLFKAERDSLTGLYNKGTTQGLIEEYINNAIEAKGALFQIDLDNFKSINDNLGHLTGDFVLTTMSCMLVDIFKENCIVGRIGGDEFLVFIKDIKSEEEICKKAEELVNGFRTNFTKEFLNYKLSGSIGIAKYPEHGTCFEELYIKADQATYYAKHRGKDNYCLFKHNLL